MNSLSRTLFILLLVCGLGCNVLAGKPLVLYVAPDGDDRNPGTREQPFATLEAARDAIRSARSEGSKETASDFSGATVLIAGGEYVRSESFVLDGRDSGAAEAPIEYRKWGDEPAVLMGGREIPAEVFQRVDQDPMLERIPENAREHVRVADLKELKITGYGELTPRNMNGGPRTEVFFDDQPMRLAQWPNEGWARTGEVLDEGSIPREGESGDRGGVFRFTGDAERLKRWSEAGDPWLHGYWHHEWYDQAIRIGSVDVAAKTIELASAHVYGIASGKRYRALNLLEELDAPGEWQLDRENGRLYFWPPGPLEEGRVRISLLDSPMLVLDGTANVTVEGLTLECARGRGVEVRGGRDNLIAGCTIRCLGGDAASISGEHNGVRGCDLYQLGGAGIRLSGGERKTLTPGRLFAENNHIHHYARLNRTYRPAVAIGGVGNRMAHNLIHDAPHVAVMYSGNDHLMEFNEIHDVCLETDDVGVFYCGRDWTYRGNAIRFNKIYNIRSTGSHGAIPIYLDDSASSTRAFGNIIIGARRAVLIGGGRDNEIVNNIFIDCAPAIRIDSRGLGWAREYQVRGGEHGMYRKLEAVNYDQPPFSTRYPKLARILEGNPNAPEGNLIERNICWGGEWAKYDPQYTTVRENYVTQENPGFVDAEKGDYRLRPDSAVWDKVPDFQQIPVDKIGLVEDKYRGELEAK